MLRVYTITYVKHVSIQGTIVNKISFLGLVLISGVVFRAETKNYEESKTKYVKDKCSNDWYLRAHAELEVAQEDRASDLELEIRRNGVRNRPDDLSKELLKINDADRERVEELKSCIGRENKRKEIATRLKEKIDIECKKESDLIDKCFRRATELDSDYWKYSDYAPYPHMCASECEDYKNCERAIIDEAYAKEFGDEK